MLAFAPRPSSSALTCLLLLSSTCTLVQSFTAPQHRSPRILPYVNIKHQCATRLFAGGFGTKQTKKPKKMNPNQAKKATQQLLERYGGDIQKGTQTRIDEALAALPPHLQEAASLYKQLTQFQALTSSMTESDRKRLIPPEQWEISNNDRIKLNELMKQHSITNNDLHNVYQRITWDASADAKATRADIAGNTMKGDLQERIDKACSIAVEAVVGKSNGDEKGMFLDIGCGHGSIVPSLSDLPLDSYVGIDLSEEMVKNAMDRYGSEKTKQGKGRVFVADDFLTHDFSVYGEETVADHSLEVFDAVMFCSSLHDLPDMESCIGRAASLLRPGGKLIVVHAQGAMHVLGQHQSNPVMVQRALPTATEWNELAEKNKNDWKLSIEYEPADPKSDRDEKEGYLAVLVKD